MKIPEIGELFDWPAIWHLKLGPIDLSVNRIVVLIWLAAAIAFSLFVVAFRKPKLVPAGLQNLLESAVDFIRTGVVQQVIGEGGEKFLPFLTTLFFFILVMNFFEVLPGVNYPVASAIAVPAALTLIVYFVYHVVGFAKGGWHYLKGIMFPPGVPWPLYIIVTPIELATYFLIRPISLAVRLFANMMAGHILLTIFFLTTHALLIEGGMSPKAAGGVVSLALSVVFVAFEVFVGMLQAYIFTILTAVYIGDSLHPSH